MNRLPRASWCAAWTLIAGFTLASTVQADALSAIQVLREGGCGGLMPAAPPLHHRPELDRAAEQWAHGLALSAASQSGGYKADVTSGLRVSGSDSDMIRALRRSSCRIVSSRDVQDIGLYRRGSDNWLVLASRYTLPDRSQAPGAGGTRTATHQSSTRQWYPLRPAVIRADLTPSRYPRPWQRSHSDMQQIWLEHDYFEHQDLTGRSPADRVRAGGYEDKLVGENIAYGPKSSR
jgi:hypothetical protein